VDARALVSDRQQHKTWDAFTLVRAVGGSVGCRRERGRGARANARGPGLQRKGGAGVGRVGYDSHADMTTCPPRLLPCACAVLQSRERSSTGRGV
jgi:hypothetical protein